MATRQIQENKLYLSIKQYLCYDINWTYGFIMMAAFVQPLFDFCLVFVNEFLYDFGVGHAPSSGAPYTFIPTSSSRKTSVEG